MRLRHVLLLLLAAPVFAQQVPPPEDSLIEHSLAMFDIAPFEWPGQPDPLRARLGMYMQDVPFDSIRGIAGVEEGTRAYRIWHLMPHWAADLGGLFIGDIVLSVDGLAIGDSIYPAPDEFVGNRARDLKAGQTLRFRIVRDRAVRTVDVPMIVPDRSPMPMPSLDRLGPIRRDSWLARTLAATSLFDSSKIIQRQMRVVADQDFSTVQFAGRPSPWRLSDITYLHHNPTRIGAVARLVTRDLWHGRDSSAGLSGVIAAAAAHLDQPMRPESSAGPRSVDELRTLLQTVTALVERAYAPLGGDAGTTAHELARMLDVNSDWEAALDAIVSPPERRTARLAEEARIAKVFAAADRLERQPLFDAASLLASLADTTWIDPFIERLRMTRQTKGAAEGMILAEWSTPSGRCVIGGNGANTYRGEYALIIDIGGSDIYDLAPARAAGVRLVIDASGDDVYRADSSGQASGVGAVDVLIDRQGNDVYRGDSWSQGAGVLGVGVLADFAGDDVYQSHWCSQGAAFHGIGVLMDQSGSDTYLADVYSQGFGYVRGFGVILEGSGNDSYRAGWKYEDSRIPYRAHLAMSQGFGFGMRPWSTGIGADGGIGVLADRAGDDLYASDFFSQGGSYWYALGVLHDRQGSDRYTAGQYSQGSGIHLSCGALLDDAGDDMYDAYAGLEQGNAHDWSSGCLEDWQGNDTYRGSNSSQGSALTVSFAWLLDSHGNDMYYALQSDSALSQGGGNALRTRGGGSLGMLIDLGKGNDFFTEKRAKPGSVVVKPNGMLYDDGAQ
jgi:hypothetical protein